MGLLEALVTRDLLATQVELETLETQAEGVGEAQADLLICITIQNSRISLVLDLIYLALGAVVVLVVEVQVAVQNLCLW